MTALTVVTLLYVFVLVVILAVVLIAVWRSLRRTGELLQEVGRSLAAAQEQSEPIERHLTPLRDACDGCCDDMERVEDVLAGAAGRLREIAESAEKVGVDSA